MFRVQKSVNVFRIDRIVFEINLTNDKQNKIANVLSNDHFKRRDEFCGKDKPLQFARVPKQWRTLQWHETVFRFIGFMDHLRAEETAMIQSFELFPSDICRVQVGELWRRNGEHVPRQSSPTSDGFFSVFRCLQASCEDNK